MELPINQIIQGDCLEVLKTFPDKSVDLVVTDPPYRVISGGEEDFGGFRSGFSLDKENKGKIFDHNDIEISVWLPAVARVMKDGSHGYVFTNQLNLLPFMKEFENNGLYVHRLLIWDKGIATWTRFYMKQYEPIIFFKKGNAKSINKQGTKDILSCHNPNNKYHPTEKPTELLRIFIENSSNENNLILDPFCGSGSALVSAKQENRNYIGIEISEKYCEIARQRVASAPTPLFTN